MENNNPPQQPPVVNTQPETNGSGNEQALPSGNEQALPSGNRMVFWFLGGLVIIILVVGGIYLFLSKQQTETSTPPVLQTQEPKPTPDENLEGDLQNINIENETVNGDLTEVDKDLQSL